jgi:hypothetical protein
VHTKQVSLFLPLSATAVGAHISGRCCAANHARGYMNAYEFKHSVPLCSGTLLRMCGQYLRFFFVFFSQRFFKQSMSVAATRSCMSRFVAFLLVFGAVAEAKLKPTTPSSAGIIPSRSVVDGYFIPNSPVPRRPFSALLVCAYMFFFRAASCFTDQSFVSCSLIMHRAWANVFLPPKPALKSQNVAHRIGRF